MSDLCASQEDLFDSQATIIYDLDSYGASGAMEIKDPQKPTIIEYVDMSNMKDNGRVIPDLVAGDLQPLDNTANEVDELFKNVNFDPLSEVLSQPDNSNPVPPAQQNPLKCIFAPQSVMNTSMPILSNGMFFAFIHKTL